MIKSFVFVGNTKVGSVFAEKLIEAGFEVAEKTEEADAILVYCESQTDLEDVFFDSEGLIQVARKGAYLIDLSASTPGFARELNAVSVISDLHVVESPLIVHDLISENTFSISSKLSCFAAGEEDDIKAVEPLLLTLVGTIQPTGTVGTAQAARAVYTIQVTAQLLACIEAESLCRAFSGSSELSLAFAYSRNLIGEQALFFLESIKKGNFASAYTIRMWTAELMAALMTADDVDLILPGAEGCVHLLELLSVIGGADMAPAALSLIYSEESQGAQHGLDWMKAERAYGEAAHEHYHDEDCEHHHDDFPGGFGAYSSN